MPITTVAKLDDWLAGDSGNYSTAQKDAAVALANTFIENYTGRIFDATDYSQWFDGSGSSELVVDQYPVIKTYRVACQNKVTAYISNSGTLPYTVSVTAGAKMHLTVAGGATSEIDLTAHATMASLKAAVDLIGNWSMTVQVEDVPKHLKPLIKNGINGTNLSLYSPDDDNSLIVNSITPSVLGSNYGFPLGFANIFLSYRAGYETMPGDLESVATQMSADIVKSSAVDHNYDSEKIGKYSYKLAKKTADDFIAPYKSVIDLYRDI